MRSLPAGLGKTQRRVDRGVGGNRRQSALPCGARRLPPTRPPSRAKETTIRAKRRSFRVVRGVDCGGGLGESEAKRCLEPPEWGGCKGDIWLLVAVRCVWIAPVHGARRATRLVRLARWASSSATPRRKGACTAARQTTEPALTPGLRGR